MRPDPRRAVWHREDPDVLRPQEDGGDGQGGLIFLQPIAVSEAIGERPDETLIIARPA
jgi:hypothetical protein